MESQLQLQQLFIEATGANSNDARSCLQTWEWDLKRALTDYKDTYNHHNHNLFPDELSSKQNYVQVLGNNCKNNTADNLKFLSPVVNSIDPSTKKPTLTKSDSIDVVDYRKLSRGISRATDNVGIVSKARTDIAMDFRNSSQKNPDHQLSSNDTQDYTFILPNIYNFPEQFRSFLEKDLIELSALNALEQANRLNWWVDNGICRKLWPLATTGDGNCLLHAASLGMWGFHDRKLTLRKALHTVLSTGKIRDSLWRRWRFQQTRLNKKAGLFLSEIEWAKEWEELVSMSSAEPRNSINNATRRRISTSERNSLISSDSFDDTATYESLEEVHILALAHVLRRTIIVISETVLKDLNGEAMAPITFGGIYLPFDVEATDPNPLSLQLNTNPLLLAYDMGHFSALVPMENEFDYSPALIPLTDSENTLSPIQFCIDPGESFDWKNYDGNEGNWALTEREQIALLKEYLDIVSVSASPSSPDEDIIEDLTDDEFDKKNFADAEVVLMSHQQQPLAIDNETYTKSKAAKQLHSVAKQFGSIGKTMSKKIKKNIGSITKIGSGSKNSTKSNKSSPSNQSLTFSKSLCAKLRIRRHEFQEKMINNYLECAKNRYLDNDKSHRSNDFDGGGIQDNSGAKKPSDHFDNTVDYCKNAGCQNFGSANTSYLCPECHCKQKYNENYCNYSGPRYGTGKSKFYAQADALSHENIRNIPAAKRLTDLDKTLYLSNSTFYNDNLPSNKTRQTYGANVHVIKVELESIDNQKKTIPTPSSSSQIISMNVIGLPSTTIPLSNQECRTKECPFYGTESRSFYCSKCYCNLMQNENLITKISISNDNSHSGTIVHPTFMANIPKTESKIISDI